MIAGAKRTGHQSLMNRVDHERIGIHHHQAEVDLGAHDDRSHQANRLTFTGRIEHGDQGGSTLGDFSREASARRSRFHV